LLSQAKAREQTGVGPRSDVEQAQAFYDATEQSVIDARNALDDANLALTEIVGPHTQAQAPLRDDIPLVAPEPASAEEWVASARQDNFDVRTAELKAEAASKDISAQRGRGLPSLYLVGSTSKLSQDNVLGGNQTLDTVALPSAGRCFKAAQWHRRSGSHGHSIGRPKRPTTQHNATPNDRRALLIAASSAAFNASRRRDGRWILVMEPSKQAGETSNSERARSSTC
jgi:hypothetical protein